MKETTMGQPMSDYMKKKLRKQLLISSGLVIGANAAPVIADNVIKGNNERSDKKHFIKRISDMPKLSPGQKKEQKKYLNSLDKKVKKGVKKRAKKYSSKYYTKGDNIKDKALSGIPSLGIVYRGMSKMKKGDLRSAFKTFKLAPIPALIGGTLINTKQRRADAAGLRDAINEYKQNQDYNKTASEYLDDLYFEKMSSITYD